MPSKYSVGNALTSAANGFLSSYMQVKQMKQQQKLQENAFIVQVLMSQLGDDNISLRQRAKILDSLPKLVGVKKMDRNLSEMLGLDNEFLDQPQEPAQKGKEGTPAQDLIDPGVVSPEMASSIRLKGTQATSNIPASSEKVGELTPALIKKKLVLEMKKAEDQQDYDKQAKILKLNYDLQMNSLKGTGFNQVVFKGYDKNGNYIVTMANQKGERKDIFLGDVDPEALVKAQISANKPSRFLLEREQYWLTQTNPETGQNYSEEEANQKALEDANKQFGLKLAATNAYIQGQNQRITGTTPITPSQSVDDRRAFAEKRATLRANINTLKRQAQDASIDSANKSKQAFDQWNNVVEPTKREMQKLLDEGYETTSPEYRGLQTKLNTEIDRYNDLKKAADDANSRDVSFKESVKEAQDILQQYETEIGGTSTNIPDSIKKAINLVRKNNPEQTKNMSDNDIINYLKSKGKIQ